MNISSMLSSNDEANNNTSNNNNNDDNSLNTANIVNIVNPINGGIINGGMINGTIPNGNNVTKENVTKEIENREIENREIENRETENRDGNIIDISTGTNDTDYKINGMAKENGNKNGSKYGIIKTISDKENILKSFSPLEYHENLSSLPINENYLKKFENKLTKMNEIDVNLIKLNNLNLINNEINFQISRKLDNKDFSNLNLKKNFLDNKLLILKQLKLSSTNNNQNQNQKQNGKNSNNNNANIHDPFIPSTRKTGKVIKPKIQKDSPPIKRETKKQPQRKRKLEKLVDTKESTPLDDSDSNLNNLNHITATTSINTANTSNNNTGKNIKIESKANSVDPIDTNDLKKSSKEEKLIQKQYDNTIISIWKDLSRKDGPKASRLLQQSNQAKLINLRKTSILAAREAKRWQLRNNKNQKDLSSKSRRAMREMFNFWKRNERIERELRKKHEKELIDKAKREEEEREAKRQSRKLNFLITQTELYSHFIGKKIKTDEIEGEDSDPNLKLNNNHKGYDQYTDINTEGTTDFNSIDFDNDDEESLRRQAAMNAQKALENAQAKAQSFNNTATGTATNTATNTATATTSDDDFKNPDTNGEEMNFQNPTLMGDINITQPNMLKCTLKEYQVKGLNWLANLYEQGINGILADEMGLGKTVQSISVLAYLAETHNIWGPYLVVTPASTLHNWQQEITKFVPNFKVLPYWGNAKDRKILRKFWDRKNFKYGKDSPFHVLVTSYQLVVSDVAYFQKMKWQYMILDEAQAIKSSQSSRWKSLLSFNCRNRLLLTGTPIQNSMQELWALLHFIMPSLFDSHDEFSDWFSKDIESHAQLNTQLNEQQLKRLHVILKPFMLRRIKKNVQSELGDKVEIDLFCDLTNRQKKYYKMLKSQISLSDLLASVNNSNDDSAQSLINLVMQFRKVCNHPDLFERADVKSSFSFSKFADTVSFMRESNDLELYYTTKNQIDYNLPRLIYDELLSPNFNNDKNSKIFELFNIYNQPEVKKSDSDSNSNNETDSLSWLKFIDVTKNDLNKLMHQDILTRSINFKQYTDINYSKVNRFNYLYDGDFTPNNFKLLINEYNNNFCNVSNSSNLNELYSIKTKVYQDSMINILHPSAEPIVSAPPINLNCNHPSFNNEINQVLFNKFIKSSLMPLSLNSEYEFMIKKLPIESYPKTNMLPEELNKLIDYSNIRMPSMNRFITESGKLSKLDNLLVNLKQNDHRVLIYFQMTKMMDLMEEYLTFRQHTYIRLDGSSKLDDRRDLVHDWQNKPEIFVFLLSTRAGGLGINLTAADTVIFYDSDWNPTIDSQAMDRAHRLGQTKQVTVYRLLTRNTIEERMRDRAKQKEQVQQVVMEGKATNNKKDENQSKKKDVAYLLLGDDEKESDDSQNIDLIQPDGKLTTEVKNDDGMDIDKKGEKEEVKEDIEMKEA